MKNKIVSRSMLVNQVSQSTLLLLLLFTGIPSLAQKKSSLPADFFRKFSYTLPAGFNYNDSLQLKTEVTKIATQLSKIQTEARSNYAFPDSTTLGDFLRATVTTNIILGNYEEII